MKTFIIAEAGKNFINTKKEQSVRDYLNNAKKLVDGAIWAGVDAIKFQTHNVEDEQLNVRVASPHFHGEDRYCWVKRNTLATPINGFWRPIKTYCRKRDIVFFSTPMSRGAAKILDEVGVDLWKIGSADILDFVMLDYLRRTGKPIIVSSGMSTLTEVKRSIEFLQEKNKKISLLHCVSEYPCPSEHLNLKMLEVYKKIFKMPIGFSDHSLEIESSLVAVASGAKIIEKHFSLSRSFWGPDHKVSLVPEEMRQLVAGIRNLEKSPKKRSELLKSEFAKKTLGKGVKLIQKDEAQFRPLFRK